MKKVFISYKFTGEDPQELQLNLAKITEALRAKGCQVFCSLESEDMYKEQKYSVTQIMKHAIEELERTDAIFVFNNSDSRSEGMLIEIGYALAKGKKIILAAKQGININSSKAVADEFVEFESVEDLLNKIKGLEI